MYPESGRCFKKGYVLRNAYSVLCLLRGGDDNLDYLLSALDFSFLSFLNHFSRATTCFQWFFDNPLYTMLEWILKHLLDKTVFTF